MWILLAALAISFIIGEKVDAIVILAILIINAVLGFIQECKVKEIDSSEVVPGDTLIIREGDKVPADARVIEAVLLEVQESILTGESLPVKKTSERLRPKRNCRANKYAVFGYHYYKGKRKGCHRQNRNEFGNWKNRQAYPGNKKGAYAFTAKTRQNWRTAQCHNGRYLCSCFLNRFS